MPCRQIQDAPKFNHTFHQARNEEEDPYTLPGGPDEDGENPYTLPGPPKVTAQQNTTPTYENFPSEYALNKHNNKNNIIIVITTPTQNYYLFTILIVFIGGRYTAERPTDNVSSTDDHSCSTCSYTGDSGFSDSREFLKQLPSKQACHQREHCLDTSSNAVYTSLITTDVQTGHYQSLNPETLISSKYFLIGVIHYSNTAHSTFQIDGTARLVVDHPLKINNSNTCA